MDIVFVFKPGSAGLVIMQLSPNISLFSFFILVETTLVALFSQVMEDWILFMSSFVTLFCRHLNARTTSATDNQEMSE